MGLIERFLPERLPRQFVFAGDGHAEVFNRGRDGRSSCQRLPGVALAVPGGEGWLQLLPQLRDEETGVVFGAAPFIFNFLDFDRLPRREQALAELVEWRLQKIFPEDIAAFRHHFYRLGRTRVLSVLAPLWLAAEAESACQSRRLPLTYIGCSTLVLLQRLQRARTAPDVVVERDGASYTLLFQKQRAPVSIRKFRSAGGEDAAGEIARTAAYVRGQHGLEPRRHWWVDLQDESAADAPPADGWQRLPAGAAPHIPAWR